MTEPGMTAGQQQMLAWVDALPAQLAQSAGFEGLDAVAPLSEPPERILCCGMGGSGLAASLLAGGWPDLRLPLMTWREHGLPSWADRRTLVVACSYSGETAETLSAAREARRRGCPTAAIGSGGRLLALARGVDDAKGFPWVGLPGGQPPRTALGASLGAVLHLLHRLEILPDPAPSIGMACAHVQRGRLARLPGGRAADAAAARTLARSLARRFVVFYTAGLMAHGAGRRWLAQFNENAKAPGHHARFPELTHNEIAGWNLDEADRDRFALVVLRDDRPTELERRAVDATVDLLGGQFASVHEVTADGPDHLSRILGLILFGDLVSTYVAVETGIDPVPIARIEALKARLQDPGTGRRRA